jgi:glycosyltransferase involved in cell wall biosynthesis
MSAHLSDGISVVIPCYNAVTTVTETLQSLLAQNSTDWKALVVDDDSTDGTVDIVTGLVGDDPRFRVMCLPRNSGLSAARNAGVQAATGRWLVFLDADDLLEPEMLREMLCAVNDGPEVEGAYCGWITWRDGKEQGHVMPASDDEITFPSLAMANRLQVPGIIVSRKALQAVGGFDERLQRCEDWDAWIRILRCGGRFRRVEKFLVKYRQNTASLSRNYYEQWLDHCRVVEWTHAPDLRCHGVRPEWERGPGDESRRQALAAGAALHAVRALIDGNSAGSRRICHEAYARYGVALDGDRAGRAVFDSVMVDSYLAESLIGRWPRIGRDMKHLFRGGNRWSALANRDLCLSRILLGLPAARKELRPFWWHALKTSWWKPRRLRSIIRGPSDTTTSA